MFEHDGILSNIGLSRGVAARGKRKQIFVITSSQAAGGRRCILFRKNPQRLLTSNRAIISNPTRGERANEARLEAIGSTSPQSSAGPGDLVLQWSHKISVLRI